MQVYQNLEHGDISVENARAYVNLGTFYFQQKRHFLPQAKYHALSARQILEQLQIKPSDEQPVANRLACDIYLLLLQCSLQAKREAKTTKNRHILAIDQTHIEHDMKSIERYLDKLKQSMSVHEYEQLNMKYLLLKFDAIVGNTKIQFSAMEHLMYQLTEYIQKYDSQDPAKHLIDVYLRCGSYLTSDKDRVSDGLRYFQKAVELAELQEAKHPSPAHKHQLARAIVERAAGQAQTYERRGTYVSSDWNGTAQRCARVDALEKEFQRAIQLYKEPTHEINKNVLKVIDELAVFYTKVGRYQVRSDSKHRQKRTRVTDRFLPFRTP